MALFASGTTARHDHIVGTAGMGGQGVLAIPVVCNGWVQHLPAEWKAQLTPPQQNPLGAGTAEAGNLAITLEASMLAALPSWDARTSTGVELHAAFTGNTASAFAASYHCVLADEL